MLNKTNNDNFALVRKLLGDIQTESGARSDTLQKLHSTIKDLETQYSVLSQNYERLEQKLEKASVALVETESRIKLLEEHEANYRAIAENFPNGMVGLFDRDLRYTLVGGKGLEATGLSREFFEGKRLRDVMPPEIYERDEPALLAALDGHTQVSTVPYNDRYFRVITSPLKYNADEVIGGLVMTQDVTEQILSENRFTTLFDTASIGILLVESDGRISLANDSACKMLGYNKEEMSQLNIENLFSEQFSQILDAVGTDYLAASNPHSMGQSLELTATRKDASSFPIEVSLSMLQTERGKQAVAFITNITERKIALENQLALAIEQHKVDVLRQFIHDASHDFRTPLSTILSSTHILKKTSSNIEFNKRVDKIEKQGLHLRELLEDMFMLLDLELNTYVTWASTDLNTFLEIQMEAFQQRSQQKQQTLQLNLPSNSVEFIGNTRLLDIAISKILENAINYTPDHGTITVSWEITNQTILIHIDDTGIGIADKDLPHIFKRFYRADKTRNIDTGGTGLGLSLAQRILEIHNGKIHVQSELGKGSRFTIELPYPSIN